MPISDPTPMFLPSCRLFLAVLFVLAGVTARADEYARFQVDLDGDGKPETVRLSQRPGADEVRSILTVAIGGEHVDIPFFSAAGDLPNLRLVAIDHARPWRQAVVETFEPAGCRFHVLGWRKGRLLQLLDFDSGESCHPLDFDWQGDLTTWTWEGFWHRPESYRLSDDGSALLKRAGTTYEMSVVGAAGEGLVLGGATCKPQAIAPGSFLRVTRFDAKGQRYLLETPGGACGWLPADQLRSDGGKVAQLPFAG